MIDMITAKKKIEIALTVFLVFAFNCSFAQSGTNAPEDSLNQGEVSTVLTPHSSNAIFNDAATYTFAIKNTFNKAEKGKVSYLVKDEFNRKLLADSVHVQVGKQNTKSLNFKIPPLKTGFYKIDFMINVTDYDDTTRRVFGIRANDIRSLHARPDDFNAFWQKAKDDLAKIRPDYKMIEQPALEKENRKVYIVEMKSLGNMTIRAWLTVPDNRPKYHKLAVLIGLPGYQTALSPFVAKDDDVAFINLDVRGQGLNKIDMDIRKEDYIVYHIEDKNKYIMRGIIMDCIRCIDFVYSRPEFSHDLIFVRGGSMGGYLSITTAALDKRVAICAPQNPLFSDVYNLDNGAAAWPLDHMREYVKIRPGLTFQKILDNLQYYDAKNFAPDITCPVFMGIGLLDPYVPPSNAFAVYNNIKAPKKIMVFKDLAHEVDNKYLVFQNLWMRDKFGLF